MASVDIIIVNWNTRDLLERLLTSIECSGLAEGVTCIVSDNDSSDGSVEMAGMRFPWARVMDNKINLGYGAAANSAIEASTGEFILLLNSDTEIFEDTIERLVSFMDQHSQAGAVGPRLVNPDGSLQYSCRRFPDIWMGTLHALLGLVWKSNPYTRKYKMQDWDHQTIKVVDWISGAAMFLRRRAVEEIGLFDERYFMYVEDVDLCWRLRKAVWQVFYYPNSSVLHHIGKSSEKKTSRMIFEHHRSVFRFYRSRLDKAYMKILIPFLAAGLALRALAVVIGNRLQRK